MKDQTQGGRAARGKETSTRVDQVSSHFPSQKRRRKTKTSVSNQARLVEISSDSEVTDRDLPDTRAVKSTADHQAEEDAAVVDMAREIGILGTGDL